ncbi:SPOR domain-containing protein [Mucilaginibacter arboris]|uniref:SPOR domain-containing protein n=1 Tax=Mucilaginibacter arboris TaxID=2682090 RepID=A0A7K1SV19_9SPHI|nr:SPOR domain-containing protein [Mucilaginibacter arboris]MVN21176.1 SPOR domain-containing protein [Mucilaginibacter arboris]
MSIYQDLVNKRSIRTGLPARMLLLAVFFLTGISFSFAQTRGEVEVIKDPRIDTLIAHRLLTDKSASGKIGSGSGWGYRVQFFISSDRKEIYAKQAEFNQMHPDLRTYIIYQEPNYKIKAGDFRTRLEAQKLMRDLRPQFPTLFLVSEKINPSKLDTTDDKN